MNMVSRTAMILALSLGASGAMGQENWPEKPREAIAGDIRKWGRVIRDAGTSGSVAKMSLGMPCDPVANWQRIANPARLRTKGL